MINLTDTKQLEPRTAPFPTELDMLLREYPRTDWEAHENFKQATKNWLSAHQGFRWLSQLTREMTESFLEKSLDSEKFVDGLGYYGNALVRNLHGHHHWEDRSYFPELSQADPRFQRGIEVLEKDHECLNSLLDGLTNKANRVIKLVQLDEHAAMKEASDLLPITEKVECLLDRHLTDEEELAVPIILHYRLRG